MTEFVEIHAIQPLGPNCINRDDAGDPKTILLNGTLRARVSSQAWKKVIRDAMRGMDLPDVGLRTKRVSVEVARRGGVDVGDAKAVLGLAKAGLEGKDGTDDADALILIGSNTLDRLGALAAEYATAEDGKAWLADKANAKAVKAVLKEDHAVDLALFGRMVASNPEYGVEAAANVAHAIGVGAFEPEYDFFSAVDDLRGAYGETDKGSGGAMIGDIAYGDATIYRYAVVDMARLESNLAGDHATAVKAAEAFVRAFLTTEPEGRVTSFASRTLPAWFRVDVTDSPLSLVDAFTSKPVDADDVPAAAAARLKAHAADLSRAYGISSSWLYDVEVGGDGTLAGALDGLEAVL